MSIVKELKRFYMNPYKSNRALQVNAENRFLSANGKTVEEEEKELCEGLIKEYEVKAVETYDQW